MCFNDLEPSSTRSTCNHKFPFEKQQTHKLTFSIAHKKKQKTHTHSTLTQTNSFVHMGPIEIVIVHFYTFTKKKKKKHCFTESIEIEMISQCCFDAHLPVQLILRMGKRSHTREAHATEMDKRLQHRQTQYHALKCVNHYLGWYRRCSIHLSVSSCCAHSSLSLFQWSLVVRCLLTLSQNTHAHKSNGRRQFKKLSILFDLKDFEHF